MQLAGVTTLHGTATNRVFYLDVQKGDLQNLNQLLEGNSQQHTMLEVVCKVRCQTSAWVIQDFCALSQH